MKTPFVLFSLCCLAAGAPLAAQYASPSAPYYAIRAPQEVDQLVGPIALYPDPLVGVLLPASTDWPEIQAADQLMQSSGSTAAVELQPWDDSVKALAHYPEVVAWMTQNIAWTQELGAAFATQPADVMNSIQRLRGNAVASGILFDTPQQRVIVQGQYISIEPAQSNVVYVPTYDPQIVYTREARPRSAISFSLGLAMGPWLAYDFDWDRRAIWIDRGRYARTYGSNRAVIQVPIRGQREEWHPRAEYVTRARAMAPQSRGQIARPGAFRVERHDAAASRGQPRPPIVYPQRRDEPLTPTGRISEPRAQVIEQRASRSVQYPPAQVQSAPVQSAPTPAAPPYHRDGGRDVQRRGEVRAPVPAAPVYVPNVPPAPAPAPLPPGVRAEERRHNNDLPPQAKGKGDVKRDQAPPKKNDGRDDDRDRDRDDRR
jgi:hypothetical protein